LTVFVDTLAPAAPTGVSAVGVSPQEIQVSWNAAVDPNGGTVAGYFVYLNGFNQQLASGTSFVYGGLSPSTTYTFTVAAYDNAGNVGPQSAPVNGTTQAPVPTVPLVPTGVGVSFSRYGYPSYTVYWGGSGAPTSYYVLWENGTTYTITGGLTSKAFNSKPAGSYSYRVKACSATNVCSAYSSPDVFYEVCGTGGCN
jgi:chitodextrinase